MKKLLITGFEPFGGETVNPSWEAVSRLPQEAGGYLLTKLRLPVTFGEAAEKVLQAAEALCPDVILCIGQAGGRNAITPELVGINLRHGEIPDNKGIQPKDQPILVHGESGLFSTLPVRRMAQAVEKAGIPAKVSYSAGAYVCNDVLYTLLAHYQGSKTRVGFIHIPYASTQEKDPCLPLEQITRGLTIAIENMDGEETI
ncbi:MAG: pyroglutamyl-peptidase I [Clostridia bacterium]|nr:pyroglutamyl-peptidase I [Clostridia bacterium]